MRVCIDLSRRNDQFEKMVEMYPSTVEEIERSSGYQLYCTCDVKSQYNCIPVKEGMSRDSHRSEF